MDVPTEESSNLNNNNIILEEIDKEHCYDGVRTVKRLHHLSDHNYFIITKPQPRKTTKKKRTHSIKITQLKAVYNCKSCGHRTMNREIFKKHTCTQIKTVPCTKCDKNKIPDGCTKCPKCSYFNKSLASLKIHMRIHENGNPYKCTECDYSGKDLQSLIHHYGGTKDLNCGCGYRTHVKQYLDAHMRSHTGEKPFSCGVCCFSTSDRAGLYRHLKKHGCF